ncbi:MAG: DUF3341 domain-containing protein [Chitinophagales bacterium]
MEHKYLVGFFDDEEPLVKATVKMRKAGYQMREVFTPFPVHGLDEAMGLQETRLHTAGFIIGACGTLTAIGGMSFISAVDWPIIVGGKPFFSAPSWVPITFELTVLFAAIGMVVIYYLRNHLSIFREVEVMDPRTTDDRFAMVFDMKQYHTDKDKEQIASLLKSYGAIEVRSVSLKNELHTNLFKQHDDLHHLEEKFLHHH